MTQINTTGRHEVTAKTATFGESKNGTPFLEIVFENSDRETLSGWLYLSQKAFEQSLKTLRETFGFNNNFETAPAQIENKVCAIEVEAEEHEGKTRLKVKWINPLRSVIPMKDASALKGFSAMAARIPLASRTTAKPAPKAASAPKQAPVTDFPTEDVPY